MLLEEEESRDLWDVLREMYEEGTEQERSIMNTKRFKIVCSRCGSEDVIIVDVHSDWERESSKMLKCKKCEAKETL